MMTEEITNYIISIAPALGAIATVLVAGIKLIKSFTSNFDTLKRDLTDKVKNLQNTVCNLSTQNKNLLEYNDNLQHELGELINEVKHNNKVDEHIKVLSEEIASTNANIENMVNDKLNQATNVIEQIKADRTHLGE